MFFSDATDLDALILACSDNRGDGMCSVVNTNFSFLKLLAHGITLLQPRYQSQILHRRFPYFFSLFCSFIAIPTNNRICKQDSRFSVFVYLGLFLHVPVGAKGRTSLQVVHWRESKGVIRLQMI